MKKSVENAIKLTRMTLTIVRVRKIVLVSLIRKLCSTLISLIMNYSAGCPCPDFDCDLLNELADSCLDLSTNENYQFCYQDQKKTLVECLDNCDVFECVRKCSETFETDVEQCPCAPKCPCKLFSYD